MGYLLDFDDTIISTRKVVVNFLNQNLERFGLPAPVEAKKSDWNWEDATMLDIPEEKFHEVLMAIVEFSCTAKIDDYTLLGEDYYEEGALDGVKVLLDAGLVSGILTSRPDIYRKEAKAIIKAALGDLIPEDKIYFRTDVIPGNPNASKVDCLRALGADGLIDNLAKNCMPIAEAGGGLKAVFYGVDGEDTDTLIYAPTWADVCRKLLSK